MGLGALTASLTMWSVLATGSRTGEMEKAFGIFIAAFMGAAAVGGILGLGIGRLAGGIWEKRHRRMRSPVAPDVTSDADHNRQAPVTVGTLTVRELSTEAQRALAIVQPLVASEGTPWGAWDGPRLVGVVWIAPRGPALVATAAVASDGYDAARLRDAVAAATRQGSTADGR
jgi:hypothetical protein